MRKLSKPGRPRKTSHDDGERIQLSLRVTPELKKRLDSASDFSGRSQSQEAELRLERSFERENLLYEALEIAYGRQLAGLILLAADVMQQVILAHAVIKSVPDTPARHISSDGQLEVPYVFDDSVRAMTVALQALRPNSDEAMSVEAIERAKSMGYTSDIGQQVALETLQTVLGTNLGWRKDIRSMLAGLGGLAKDQTPADQAKVVDRSSARRRA
ncbi:MAG: TraY domain-containing protein [Reyranellaceae bacterium]